jgi:DNA-binding beta-propeller fold protein YncE
MPRRFDDGNPVSRKKIGFLSHEKLAGPVCFARIGETSVFPAIEFRRIMFVQTPLETVHADRAAVSRASRWAARLMLCTAFVATMFVATIVPARALLAQVDQLKLSSARVRAPSLNGAGEWLNTAGPIELSDMRGKFVVLDFWTYCCINCMHILPELKKAEQAYPNNLVVIGVHSAKFFTERDAANIREAIVRYDIEHPVVNDSNLVLWRRFGVSVWPTLVVIDPEGYVVATHQGEITFEAIDNYMKRNVGTFRRRGVLDETPLHFDLERSKLPETPLQYPGKVLADEASGRLFIADSNHNRIVVARLDGTLLDVIGSGAIGRSDGPYTAATFDHPQGIALSGSTLYVADTENHSIRKVDLVSKRVTTIAGTGSQSRTPVTRSSTRPTAVELSSPWDLLVAGDDLYIAMAGAHQIWSMPLDESRIGPVAGNGTEDIVDGPLLPRTLYQRGFASFAQPSGLASDGRWLFVADSEGSSIRAVPLVGNTNVATVVGTSNLPAERLFTFGDRDGPIKQALLQHPLAVVFLPRRLYVADTYNNKIKEIDFDKRTVSAIAGDFQPGNSDEPPRFDEPAGLSHAGGKLYVADTNNHRIRVIDLQQGNKVSTLEIRGLQPPSVQSNPAPVEIPGTKTIPFETASVRPVDSQLNLTVELALPAGWKLNPLAPMSYQIDVAERNGVLDPAVVGKPVTVAEPSNRLDIKVPTRNARGRENISVSLTFYYCREGAEALCRIGRVVWTGPVVLSESADAERLRLLHTLR